MRSARAMTNDSFDMRGVGSRTGSRFKAFVQYFGRLEVLSRALLQAAVPRKVILAPATRTCLATDMQNKLDLDTVGT